MIHEVIMTEMIKRKRQERPGHAALMALLSFGLNETQLAAELSVDHSLVSSWRLGKRPIPVHRQRELYATLKIFLDAQEQTIKLLKEAKQWDKTMSKLVRQKFREAQRIYGARSAQFRDEATSGGEAAA